MPHLFFPFYQLAVYSLCFRHHVETDAYVKGAFAKSFFRFLVYDWYTLCVLFMNSFFTYVVFVLHVYLVRKVELLVGSHRFMKLLVTSLLFIFFQRWIFAYFLEPTNGCIMLMSIFAILFHSLNHGSLLSGRSGSPSPNKLYRRL